MGLVDADFEFIWNDTSGFGHMSDFQIFNDSELNECFLNGTIGLLQPDKLLNDDKVTPYLILGDIFAVVKYLKNRF